MAVIGGQLPVFEMESAETSLVIVSGVLGLLLEGFLVVVVVETVLGAVAALDGDETGTLAKTKGA